MIDRWWPYKLVLSKAFYNCFLQLYFGLAWFSGGLLESNQYKFDHTHIYILDQEKMVHPYLSLSTIEQTLVEYAPWSTDLN